MTTDGKPSDLPPAFEPFVAAKAMKTTLDNSAITKVLASYRESAKALDRIRIPSETLRALTETARAAEASRLAQSDFLDGIEAQNRKKIQIEQATINNAKATAVLVDVAQKQESAMESIVGLLGTLVEHQHDLVEQQTLASSTNRRRWRMAIVVAVISATAAVTGVMVTLVR